MYRTEDELRRAMCTGKTKFLTRSQAKQARRRVKGKGLADQHGRLNSYCCRFCGYWHNGRLSSADAKQHMRKYR